MTSQPDIQRDNLRGGLLMLCAMLGFALEDAMFKGLTNGTLPIGQIMMMVGVIGTLVMGAIAVAAGAPLASRAILSPPVLMRNIGEAFGGIGFVIAIALIPLSTASAIFQALPLAMTAGAALFMREKVGWRRWTAITVGFIGVLVILRPTGDDFNLVAACAALSSVAMLAMRDLATRRIAPGIHSLSLATWGMFSYALGGVVLLAWEGQMPIVPTSEHWMLLLVTASFGLGAYYLLITACRIGEISAIMPARYGRIVFAMILGAIFFAERPDAWMVAGCALIIASGLYTLLRERRLALSMRK